MTKCLVAYYSWHGNTAKVAQAIAEELSADLEEILDAEPRAGLLGYVRSGFEAWSQLPATIKASTKSVAQYDVVILGCPVWAHHMASPMRSYILREEPNFRRVALFCTLGGAYGEQAIAALTALCNRPPIAELLVTAGLLKSGQWRELAIDFARSLRTKTEPTKAADQHQGSQV